MTDSDDHQASESQPPSDGYTAPLHHTSSPAASLAQKELSEASIVHLLGIVGFLGPLIFRLVNNSKSQYVRAHSNHALNFHISIAIYSLALAIIACGVGVVLGIGSAGNSGPGAGIALFALVAVVILVIGLIEALAIVASCVGAMKAKQGHSMWYPGTIRFLK